MEGKYVYGDSNDSEELNRSSNYRKYAGSDDDYRQHDEKISSINLHAEEKQYPSSSSRYAAKKEAVPAKHTADYSEEKSKLTEIQQDIEADEEFEALKRKQKPLDSIIGQSALAKRFVSGFRMYVQQSIS